MNGIFHVKKNRYRTLMTQAVLLACFSLTVHAVSPLPAPVEVSVPAPEGAAGTLVMSDHDAEKNDRTDVISLELPALAWDGTAPLDFHIDPDRLIEKTGAARYGGGFVEAGATLLFHNAEGAYRFSSTSDSLRVKNSGAVPAIITVEARIEGLDDAVMTDSYYFNDGQCSIYLALVDDRGAELPIPADGVVTQEVMVYADETYAFGLTGTCNPLADWSGTDTFPVVSVTWHVEPVFAPDEDGLVEAPEAEEVIPLPAEEDFDASLEENNVEENVAAEPESKNTTNAEDEGMLGNDALTNEPDSNDEEAGEGSAEAPMEVETPAPESVELP